MKRLILGSILCGVGFIFLWLMTILLLGAFITSAVMPQDVVVMIIGSMFITAPFIGAGVLLITFGSNARQHCNQDPFVVPKEFHSEPKSVVKNASSYLIKALKLLLAIVSGIVFVVWLIVKPILNFILYMLYPGKQDARFRTGWKDNKMPWRID